MPNTHLQHTLGLVDGATEAQVVDGGVLHNALLVDDEQAAESNAVGGQHTVGLQRMTSINVPGWKSAPVLVCIWGSKAS